MGSEDTCAHSKINIECPVVQWSCHNDQLVSVSLNFEALSERLTFRNRLYLEIHLAMLGTYVRGQCVLDLEFIFGLVGNSPHDIKVFIVWILLTKRVFESEVIRLVTRSINATRPLHILIADQIAQRQDSSFKKTY